MTDREKLAQILEVKDNTPTQSYLQEADILIANGVTVQKRGEWINQTRNMKGLIDYRYVCSVCGHSFGNTGAKNFNYCPACGAVML